MARAGGLSVGRATTPSRSVGSVGSVAVRPRRTYATGWVTRVLRWLALLGMLAVTIVVLRRYPDLPQVVPTHFGAGGEVDDVGPRWSVLVLVGVMWVLVVGVGWLSARPRILNYPAEVTETNAQRLYREGERMLVWLMVALVVLSGGLVAGVLGEGGGALVWLGLGGCVVAAVVGIVRALRTGRAGAACEP